MAKNGFLERQKATQRAYFDAGLQSGRQQILELAEAYGDGMADSFLKRYEFAPEFDYTRGRWK